MQAITTIGLDIAKSVFQVHGVDAEGNVVFRRRLKRRYVRRSAHQKILQFGMAGSLAGSNHLIGSVCAVHMTAGHNALRGSGPGQKHAFKDALAHCGLS
jgi:transposase